MTKTMHFRDLLIMLDGQYGKSSFLVIDMVPQLKKMVLRWPTLFPKSIENPKSLALKSLSNDMRRLYSMGFVKRRREKRPNSTSFLKGEPNNRGFQYRYSISNNGLNYLDYLKRAGYKPTKAKSSGIPSSGNGAVFDLDAAYNKIRRRQGLEARFAGVRERGSLLALLKEKEEKIKKLENHIAILQMENLKLRASK